MPPCILMANKKWKDNSITLNILKILDESGTVVFYDVETTGRSLKKDRIIQFSAVRTSAKDFSDVLDRINIYIKCPFSVPAYITEINHIDDELLKQKGMNEEMAHEAIYGFLKEDDIIIGYNNNAFDNKYMEALYERQGFEFHFKESIDVFRYAKTIIPTEDILYWDEKQQEMKPVYKLMCVTEHYDPENTFKFHDSNADIDATKFIFGKLIEDGKKYIQEAESEEEKRKDIPRQKVNIFSLNYFSPRHTIQRVYVSTDQGQFFYDNIRHEWNTKSGNLDSIDVEDMKNKAFKLLGVNDEDAFVKAMKKEKYK